MKRSCGTCTGRAISRAIIDGVHDGALAVGMGRSYGDVCLLKDGTLVQTTG